MRGHILKRGKNSYTVVVSLGRDPTTGKRKQQWISVKGTRKGAETRLSEVLNQLDNGTFLKPGKTTLAEYLQKWLAEYAKPRLSPQSYERYANITRQYLIPELGNMPLTQLKPEHLQRWYATKQNKGISARTIKYNHAVIHKALATAIKWGLLTRNVADGVDMPRVGKNEMQVWSEGEVTHFLEASKGSPYYELFFMALFTGMRRGELLALRWQDVDFIYSQVYVNRSLHQLEDRSYIFTEPKSAKSRRTIALSPSAILTLKDLYEKRKAQCVLTGTILKDSDLIFSTPEGRSLCPDTVTAAWSVLAARAGVKPIRLHDARHTHASMLLKQGVHPKIVQERLGHSTIAMTLDTYSHVAPGLQEAAAAAFDKMLFPNREKEAPVNGRLAKC